MFEKTYISTNQLTKQIRQTPHKRNSICRLNAHNKIARNSFRMRKPTDHKKKNMQTSQGFVNRDQCYKNRTTYGDQIIEQALNRELPRKLLTKNQNIIEHNIASSAGKTVRKTQNPFKRSQVQLKKVTSISRSIQKQNIIPRQSKNNALDKCFVQISKQIQRQQQKSLIKVRLCQANRYRQQVLKIKQSKNDQSYEEYFTPKHYDDLQSRLSNSLKSKLEQINLFNISSKTSHEAQIKKIQRQYNLTRYNTKKLESIHRAMIEFSGGFVQLLKKSFLVVLNMEGILIEQNRLQRIQCPFEKLSNFEEFLKTFKKIQTDYFKQSIIDYLQILFQRTDTDVIDSDYILEVYLKRMKQKEAYQLHELTIKKIREKFGYFTKSIKLEQFYRLCYCDYTLCSKINENFIHQKNQIQSHGIKHDD